MHSRCCLPLFASLFLFVSVCAAQEGVPGSRHATIVEALSPSLVQVEYSLQYDKGETPRAIGWAERCPDCGRHHTQGDFEELVRQEQPLRAAGFLVSPTHVVTRDLLMHPRFIRQIAVRQGEHVIGAGPESYARDQVAVTLVLDGPLPGSKPLTFDVTRPPPYVAVSCGQRQGRVQTSVRGVSPGDTTYGRDPRRTWAAPFASLIADGDGVPVGLAMRDELPLDDSWKGSPLDWPGVSADQMNELLAAREDQTSRTITRVALSFRSPKQARSSGYWGWNWNEQGTGTEHNATGVLVDAKRVLVLRDLPPKTTARLTRIMLHPADGKAIRAAFVGTLKDYGGFIVETETPLDGEKLLGTEDVAELRDKLLLGVDVTFQGEKRVAYFSHVRFSYLEPKWRDQIFPFFVGARENVFVYDTAGRLLAIPISRRQRVTEKERWSGSNPSLLLPAAYLMDMLADLPVSVDPSNLPLDEAHENRLAWMGATLQGLDRELARARNVSDLTSDGETGAVVSYVYPDSPAAEAGIKTGFILLRLQVEGEPKPLEVKFDHDEGRSFPWEMLDEVPEEVFDQIPVPWPSAEDEFTRALTDLGIGRKYVAEFFHDGEVLKKAFENVEGPPHFESAPRYKSKALGLTVRDFTYEVRRYFQKEADDPGVVISRIEPGSKAAVAGMKPFELITHVNDLPVRDVKDFEKLIADQTELRIAVKRLTTGRIVKIKMSGPTSQSASMPAEQEQPEKPRQDEEEG